MCTRWIKFKCHWTHRVHALADVHNFARRSACQSDFLENDARQGKFVSDTFRRTLTFSSDDGMLAIRTLCDEKTDYGVWRVKGLTTELVYCNGIGGCNRVVKLVMPCRKRAPRQFCMINNNNVVGLL